MSSIEHEAYRCTRETLREMARQGLFRAAGDETIRGITDKAVVGRLAAKQDQSNEGQQGENNILMPGIVVMHVKHTRPPTGGENDYDDGIITQLVQIIDRFHDKDDQGIESYLKWQSDIREALQTNPYRSVTHPFGCIYYVQVSDQVAPGNEAYVLRQAKLVTQVNLYTRTRINRETMYHDN